MKTTPVRPLNPLKENPEGILAFQWHITDNCDQRCRHCYIFAEDGRKKLCSMDRAQLAEVVRKCEEFTARLDMKPAFAITGGDPLLSPDFWYLAELLKEKNYSYSMMGNPFHLNEEVCRRLKESGCAAYQMSIDGTQETHDRLRMPGSYRETMRMIPVISGAGIRSLIMMTVSDLNYREFPEVMDSVEKAGADVFSFARYVPTSKEKSVGIEPMKYRELLDLFANKRREAIRKGSFTSFIIKDHLMTLYYYEEGLFHPPAYAHRPGDHMPAGCHCGNAMLTILPDGTVMACRRMESSVLGNLFHEDLFDLWTKAKEKYRRYEKFEICSGCRLSPWCRGCPAIAEMASGSMYAGDPQCWHVVDQRESKDLFRNIGNKLNVYI